MIERERRYLLEGLPQLPLDYHMISQGYFFADEPGADSLRIRKKESFFAGQPSKTTYELTKKFQLEAGRYGLAKEYTIPISTQEFALLWPLAPHQLEKKRYELPLADNLTAEIDLFAGRLDGYQIVEVEFVDEETSKRFTPPNWFGREITDNDWATNSIYARLDRAQIQELVAGTTTLKAIFSLGQPL